MNKILIVIIAIIALYYVYKVLKRLVYTLSHKGRGSHTVLKGRARTKTIDAGFKPIYHFFDADTLYFASYDKVNSRIYLLNDDKIVEFMKIDGKLMTAPLKIGNSLFCVDGNNLLSYSDKKFMWKTPVLKSRISNPGIRPLLVDNLLYFPESDLLYNKKSARSVNMDGLPAIKRINMNTGSIDISLPLQYKRSRYGMIGGCDTNVVFDEEGEYFYVGLQTGYLLKVISKTFFLKCSLKLPATSQERVKKRTDFDFGPIIDDKYVYIGFNGTMLQIDKESFEIKNEAPYFQDPGSMVTERGSNDIYFASFGNIYRLNKSDFKSERVFTSGQKFAFIKKYDKDHITVLASNRRPSNKRLFDRYDGFFHILNIRNGQEVLTIRIHDIGSSDIINIGNIFYIVMETDNVLKIEI